MGPLLIGEYMPAKTMKLAETITLHIKQSYFNIQKLQGQLKGMVKEKQITADRLYRDIQLLQRYEAYTINFHKRFEVQWKQMDYETSEHKPAVYNYQPLMRKDGKSDNWGIY